MNQSPSIAAIAPALVAALGALDDVTKTNTAKIKTKAGDSYSYTFANLADAMTMVRPVLVANGLCVLQPVSVLDNGDPEVTTVLLHTSGEWMSSRLTMSPIGKDPQALGSAITFSRRYALFAMLGIATEDDDGAQASRPRPAPEPEREPELDSKALALVEDLRSAPPEVQDAIRSWRPKDMKLTAQALTADPAWRASVETFLSEQLAAHSHAEVEHDEVELPPAEPNAAEDLVAAILASPQSVRDALTEWRGTRAANVRELTKSASWFKQVSEKWSELISEHARAGES